MFAARYRGHELEKYKECSEKLPQPDDSLCTNCGEEEDVVGVIIMADGKVKQRIRGNTETLVECVREVERWGAL